MDDENAAGSLEEGAGVERGDVVAGSRTSLCASWRTCSCCSCCSAMVDRVPDKRKKQATTLMAAARRVWLVGDVVSDAVVVASIPRKRFPNTFRAAIAIIIFPAVVLLCAFYGPLRQEKFHAGDDDDADARPSIEDVGEADDEEKGTDAPVSTREEATVPCDEELEFFVTYVLVGFPAIVFIDIALATFCVCMETRTEWKENDKLVRYERARRLTETLLESTLQACLQIYLFAEKEVDALTVAIAFIFSMGNLIYLVLELRNETNARAKADGRTKASFVDFFNHVVFVIALGLGSSMVEYANYNSSEITFYSTQLTRREFRDLCKRIGNSTVVTSLSLDSCGLTGTLRPLAHATSLTKLNLGFNKFEDDLESLRNHTSLTYLDLRRSNIQGDLEPLRNHTSLTRLYLGGCEIQGDFEPLRNHTNLEVLDLGYCENVEGDLEPIRYHANLTYLDLRYCNIQGDLEPLRNHTKLRYLDLRYCKIQGDLGPLRNHTKLRHLDLHSCNIQGDLEPLRNHTKLRYLDLEGCKIQGNLEPLRKLTNLIDLRLSGCKIRGNLEPLRNHANLTYLGLHR